MKQGRNPRILILVALLTLASAWSLRPVDDIDVQWHIKIGQWMLDHGQVVTRDFYSVSRWGQEWISIPWLYQCFMAWLVQHLGWTGPSLWQWLVALIITLQTAFLIWLYRRPASRWDWAWPALSLPAALGVLHTLQVTEFRFQHRPEMTTHVLMPLFVILLTVWRRHAYFSGSCKTNAPAGEPGGPDPTGPAASTSGAASETAQPQLPRFQRWRKLICRRGIWVLPLLQVLWANAHGVFGLGPIVVWTFIVAEWLIAILRQETGPRRQSLIQLTSVGLAVVAGCFVSPYGWKTAFYPFHLFYVLTAPEYKYGISEAIPVSVMGMWQAGGLNWLFLGAWSLALIGLLGRLASNLRSQWPGRRWLGLAETLDAEPNVGYLAVCAGLFYISITAIRNVPLFSLIAAPLMVSGLEYLLDGCHWLIGRFGQTWFGRKTAGFPDGRPDRLALFQGRWTIWSSRAVWFLFIACLLLLYRAIVSERYYESVQRNTRVALGQSDHSFPIAAYDFLHPLLPKLAPMAMLGDTKCADMFLNRFGPRWKTYIDGRHAEIYDAGFFSRYGETLGRQGAYFQEAGKYGIGLAVFCTRDIPLGAGDLQREIYRHPGWSLIYLDDCACVFLARTALNEEVCQKYALPPAPASMEEQLAAYLNWLKSSGRTDYTLFEPANRNLSNTTLARLVVQTAQFGGLWRPTKARYAWHKARVASILSKLGWPAVADNIYELGMVELPLDATIAAEAIQHAIACSEACDEPETKQLYLERARKRAIILAAMEEDHPAALYGLAFTEGASGHPDTALARLEPLVRRQPAPAVLDLQARLTGELGDMAATQPQKERVWREAVYLWRERLARYPAGPGTFHAYLRLGDLFQRLHDPLLARANYVCGLNEPDLPAMLSDRVRNQVRQLEERLFGASFVPDPAQAAVVEGPFSPPEANIDTPPGIQPARQPNVPVASRPVPGSALPAGPGVGKQAIPPPLYSPLRANDRGGKPPDTR